MDEVLTIGEFATRSGLSAKRLRSYAANGLLVPAAIDGSTGYRYYATGQLHRARVIALLRRAGVAIDEISAYLSDPDESMLDRWEHEIVAESARRRRALAEARATQAAGEAPAPTRCGDTRKGPLMHLELHGGSAMGTGGRATQQDAALVSDQLFAVADGIGGLRDGDVASRLALAALEAAFAADHSVSGLLNAGREANDAVWRHATSDGGDATMGTTLTAVAITSDAAAVVLHAGDSRLYRLRDGRLDQLSDDHTVVADLVRAGELSGEAARHHPQRHILTRALGIGRELEMDHARLPCKPADRLVLCTDGLVKALTDDEVSAELGLARDPQACAVGLLERALEHGAQDNVTALVIDVG